MSLTTYQISTKVLYFFFDNYFAKFYWTENDIDIPCDLLEENIVTIVFKSFSWLSLHKLNNLVKEHGLSKYFRFKRKNKKGYYKLMLINLDEDLISLFRLQGMQV